MKIKVAEATKHQLNWLAAKCEGIKTAVWPDSIIALENVQFFDILEGDHCEFSTSPAQAGPIIDRENIFTSTSGLLGHGFSASKWKLPINVKFGNELICKADYAPTRLIAAMRCWVSFNLGEEVEVPDELV